MNQRGFVLPSPTLIMAGVIIALSLSNVILFKLYRSTADEYAQYKADVLAAQEAVRIDNERKIRELAATNSRLDEGWRNATRELTRLGRVIRVQPNRCAGAVPANQGAGSTQGLSQPQLGLGALRSITVEECEARLNSAVEDAAYIEWVGDWLNDLETVTR